MSGHSKWSTIKRKKEKTDNQRAKIFTKIGREIAVAVREGGPDPASNSKLKDIISKAKANNVPNDNIDRIIKKAAGDGNADNYEEIMYEGYGPSGIAVIVETLTDNRNRTAGDMRHYFDKFGGNLGATGSVGWMFDRKGLIVVDRKPGMDEDEMMMLALDCGASDMQANEDSFEVYTEVSDFSSVREGLEKAGCTFLSAELTRIPQNTTAITDPETLEKINKLLDALDDMDDVQNVYHNGELPEEKEEDD